MSKMSLSKELEWRGFINQTTFSDISLLDSTDLKFYNGYDASSDSLTVGNLAAVMMDRCFLRHGVEGIIVAGGATSLIGDPGGKDSERPLQSETVIKANVESIGKQLKTLLNEHTILVNNLDWFKNLNVLDFLRDVGKYFSMTPLVQRDYIAKRMGESGSGITYTELSYTLLQGYDFLQLFDKYGVNLQLAGSDQWGNSLSGVELVKKVRNKEVNVLTCPLIINQTTGKKFGKSENGTVWLSPEKTSPLDFYQFWFNVDDKGVFGYLKVFTELDPEEVEKIIEAHKKDPSKRQAQLALAYEVTKLVHGDQTAKAAQSSTGIINGEVDVTKLSLSDLNDKHTAIKTMSITSTPASLVDILTKTGLANSNGEARRLIDGKAVYVNDVAFNKDTIDKSDFGDGSLILIRKGKNRANAAVIELK